MPPPVRPLPVLLLALCLPGRAHAVQTLAAADSLLARGDTNGALAVYETLVKQNLRNAEAHYRAGVLYMTRHVPGEELSPNRRRAEEHFRYATRFEGDSAKYWLALAELFRGEDWTFTRMQVRGLVDKAREAAIRTGAREQLAPVAYRAAREEWERYEHRLGRVLFNDFANRFDPDRFMRDNAYASDFLERGARPDPGDPGEEQRTRAELHLQDALSADPGDLAAAGLYAVLLVEADRAEEAVPVARRALAADPDRGPAWALLGLVYARVNRWAEAQAAFDTALTRMTPAERRPYENLPLILRRADALAWGQAPPDERVAFDSLYWNVATPLLLTGRNETRTEFFARLTYVLHRWSDPLRGYAGPDTDIGAVYVRYGPPNVWWSLGRGAGGGMSGSAVTPILWVYARHNLRFLFDITAGYNRARFGGDAKETYRVAVQQRPALFENVPLVATLDTVLVQVAQFRGTSPERTDVGVFGFVPVNRMVRATDLRDVAVTSGAIVQRADGSEVQRVRRDEVVRGGTDGHPELRTWRMRLAPATGYLLRVEAHLPLFDRGARSVAPLDVRRFGSTLAVSDVLLATRVAPRDSTAARWTDYFIEPSAGRFAPGESVSLLWEVYNVTPDSTGLARYTVEVRVTVEEIERHGFFARVIGGVADAAGLSAQGDDAVSLAYERAETVAPGGTLVEHLQLELEGAPRGNYTLEVVVRDQRTGATARSARRFVVTDTPLTRDP